MALEIIHRSKDVKKLGFRVRVSSNLEELDSADVLLLPGVGAFPKAMDRLNKLGLADYLRRAAQLGRPIIGICLGMQLLTEGSSELGETAGLSLIPGKVTEIGKPKWHIGWNGLEVVGEKESLIQSDGDVYFNHSFAYNGPDEFISAYSRVSDTNKIVAIISRGSVVGIQFHPEKVRSLVLSCFQD